MHVSSSVEVNNQQHISAGNVPLLAREKLPVVGIGKHLCGAATGMIDFKINPSVEN